MQRKKRTKKLSKVVLTLVIAFAMVGAPAASFAAEDGGDGGDGDAGTAVHAADPIDIAADTTHGETGTPPYPQADMDRNEDNRYNGTHWSDPYSADRTTRPDADACDVDVTYLVRPDPGEAHNSTETDLDVMVTNWDDEASHEIKIYAQIYKETEFEPFVMWEDDMESCCLNWTATDGDGDGNTWDRTTQRSNSPDHSWHNVQDCVEGTVGNSNDTLISREIEVEELCDGEKPTLLWLDWMQWIQGEESENRHKYEDYGNVYVKVDDGDWLLLASYLSSHGEWVTSDPEYKNTTAEDWSYSVPWYSGNLGYEEDGDHLPLGYRIPFTQDNETIQIKFEWTSDACQQYEGWYIDDVKIRAQCGGEQELVEQMYKPVNGSFTLAPFDDTYTVSEDNYYRAPFQEMLRFHIPFDPQDDTTYFFEIYSEVSDCEDPDGHFDYQGAMDVDGMTGNSYWDPLNGVNESVYFGDWHDGAATSIAWPEKEITLHSGSCVDVPITATVRNKGTVEEPIPYTIDVAKTVVEFPIKDDIEKGTGTNAERADYYTDPTNWPQPPWLEEGNSWEIGYFQNPDAIDWRITDWDYSSATHAWMNGEPATEEVSIYAPDQWCALRPPWMDVGTYIDQGVDIGLAMDMSWSLDSAPNPGYQGHYANAGDAVIFGTADPVNDVWLHLSSTEVTGYQPWDTFTVSDLFYMYDGYSDSGDMDNLNDLYSAHKNIMSLFGYNDPDGKLGIFASVMTDAEGVGADGQQWGGFLMDNVYAFLSTTGEVVWSTSGVTEPLKPGETSEDIEVTWPACSYSDYTAVVTTHVEDDWNTEYKDKVVEGVDLSYMYNDERKTNNLYIHDELYNENFEGSEAFTEAGEFSPEWSTEDNTFGETAYWTICSDNAPGWQENKVVWTGEGDDTDESGYAPGMDEVLIPGEDEDVKIFNWTGEESVTLEFDLWYELEQKYDYLTLEVTNDSGENWWIVDFWSNLTNDTVNQEEWIHYNEDGLGAIDLVTNGNLQAYTSIEKYTLTDMINVGVTDEMSFRFHFLSDTAQDNKGSSYNYKGAYIDDVKLTTIENETVPYDGTDQAYELTETVLFEDDFEDGLGKWLNVQDWTGSVWHVSDTCGSGSAHSAANFDPSPWSSYGKQLEPAWHVYNDTVPDMRNVQYHHNYMDYRYNADDKLILDTSLEGIYQAYLRFMINHSIAEDGDYMSVEITDDGGENWYEITRYSGDSGGFAEQTVGTTLGYPYNYGLDLTEYAGKDIELRFRMISNEPNFPPKGWETNDLGGDAGDSWKLSPKGVSCCGYANGDEYGAVVHNNYNGYAQQEWLETEPLAELYYAGTIEFDHCGVNTSLAEEVYMKVGKIWHQIGTFDTTTTCTHETISVPSSLLGNENVRFAIVFNKASGTGWDDWLEVDNITVSSYGYYGSPVGFTEDFEGVSRGVQIDNISIVGKQDTEAPVTAATLNPATPDGCNGWYTGDVTVTLAAQDNVKLADTYYRINGGNWLKYTGPVTIDDDGEYTIDYYSTDAYGNEEEFKTVSFKIDGTAPTGSITFPQAGYIYLFGNELMPRIFGDPALIIGGLTATASASDDMSGVDYVTFTTGQGTVEDAVSPYQYNLPFYFPFGSDTLTVSVTDVACNSANVGSVDYVKIL